MCQVLNVGQSGSGPFFSVLFCVVQCFSGVKFSHDSASLPAAPSPCLSHLSQAELSLQFEDVTESTLSPLPLLFFTYLPVTSCAVSSEQSTRCLYTSLDCTSLRVSVDSPCPSLLSTPRIHAFPYILPHAQKFISLFTGCFVFLVFFAFKQGARLSNRREAGNPVSHFLCSEDC